MVQITWSIWTVPSLLSRIRAQLVHPLARDAPAIAVLVPLDVALADRAQRISVGKYFNLTMAECVGRSSSGTAILGARALDPRRWGTMRCALGKRWQSVARAAALPAFTFPTDVHRRHHEGPLDQPR